MEKIIFTKGLITNSQVVREQWRHLTVDRKVFINGENALAKEYGVNATALVTKDYWREVDDVTTRVFRNESGMDMMADLMTLATNINIGKTVAVSRMASDAGKVVRTISGQEPEDLDKTRYSYSGDVIPIFKTGYGREWRELLGMQSEGFDPLIDDQENTTFNLRADMADYLLVGDASLNVNGVYTAYGITNHPNTVQLNLSASGTGALNIDLQTATPDEIVKFFNQDFQAVLDAQNVFEPVTLWVSPSVRRSFSRPYSNAAGFKGGTIEDYILAFGKTGNVGRIASIGTNFKLTGNHFVGYVKNALYIRPRVAQPVSTYAEPRTTPHANFNFLTWAAMGLQIRRDFSGRSKVFNAYGTQTAL